MIHSLLKSFVLGAGLLAFLSHASVPDGLITSKTKLVLWTAAGVRSTAVHVDTNDGIVTLYGKVPTVEQKTVAGKTAHSIAGVRAVKNLLQVVAEVDERRVALSDADARQQAKQWLNADDTLKDSAITVKSVDKGVVLLSGKASSFSDHLRAVVLMNRMPGVGRVISRVQAPEAFGSDERVTFASPPSTKALAHTTVSDLRTSVAVKQRLLTSAQVMSTEVSVDTDEGVVTLFGLVPTGDVKTAGAEARKVSGVIRVQNQLEVVASSQKKVVDAKDEDLTRDLARVFKQRHEFGSVTTSVKNGIVRLI